MLPHQITSHHTTPLTAETTAVLLEAVLTPAALAPATATFLLARRAAKPWPRPAKERGTASEVVAVVEAAADEGVAEAGDTSLAVAAVEAAATHAIAIAIARGSNASSDGEERFEEDEEDDAM